MKTRRRLRMRKRRTRKRGGMWPARSSSSSSSSSSNFMSAPAAAGTGAASKAGQGASSSGQPLASAPASAVQPGTRPAGSEPDDVDFSNTAAGTGAAAAASPPAGEPVAPPPPPIAVPPAGPPYGGPFWPPTVTGLVQVTPNVTPVLNAENLRRILRVAAFRYKQNKSSAPLLYASKSSELEAVPHSDPAFYHISSACGSDYNDLAARLTYALRWYQPGVPYYDVALELVTKCLDKRVEKANSLAAKGIADTGHESELRLITNLRTAIENCRSIGAAGVVVEYTQIGFNKQLRMAQHGFVLYIPPSEYVWPPNSKMPARLYGFTVGRNIAVKPNYLE